MSVVTIEDLAMAISNRVKIDVETAMGDANFVMDIFGYNDRIEDNVLEPEDRQLFYILEEEGILISEREEIVIYDMRIWRTHYWFLNKETILSYEGEKKKVKEGKDMGVAKIVLEEIPDEMWFGK